jgi:hypothetical protein
MGIECVRIVQSVSNPKNLVWIDVEAMQRLWVEALEELMLPSVQSKLKSRRSIAFARFHLSASCASIQHFARDW